MKKKVKLCMVFGKNRMSDSKYSGILLIRTYNKKLAIEYAKKHSDDYAIIDFNNICVINLFGGDKGR